MTITSTDKMTKWFLYDLPRKLRHICFQEFSLMVGIFLRLPYLLSWFITQFLTLTVTFESSNRGVCF
jgi:hypothetical protein